MTAQKEKARRFITGGLLYQQPIRGSQYIRGNPEIGDL